MAEHVVRCAIEGDGAVVEHEDAIAELRKQRDHLLDDDHGDTGEALGLPQHVENRSGADGVEGGGGLIEDEDARGERQNRGDGDLLFLPTRK